MAFSSPGWKAACPQSSRSSQSSAPNTLKRRPEFGEQKAKKQEKNNDGVQFPHAIPHAVYSADGHEGTPHRRRRIYRRLTPDSGVSQERGDTAVARCPLYGTGSPWPDPSPVEPLALALLDGQVRNGVRQTRRHGRPARGLRGGRTLVWADIALPA